MNGSWLIGLLTAVLLTAAVALELRSEREVGDAEGARRSEPLAQGREASDGRPTPPPEIWRTYDDEDTAPAEAALASRSAEVRPEATPPEGGIASPNADPEWAPPRASMPVREEEDAELGSAVTPAPALAPERALAAAPTDASPHEELLAQDEEVIVGDPLEIPPPEASPWPRTPAEHAPAEADLDRQPPAKSGRHSQPSEALPAETKQLAHPPNLPDPSTDTVLSDDESTTIELPPLPDSRPYSNDALLTRLDGLLAPSRPIPKPTQGDAWWSDQVPKPQREGSKTQSLDVMTLVQETILHSEHVRAVSTHAQVRETEIAQAEAAFDPLAFVDSRWVDTSEPVGNLLTTGGPPRLSREEWTGIVGFRRKIQAGGDFEVAQRLGNENNNSVFFVPADQATSRLTVSLNQPLLKGGGKTFNRSLILLAMHDTQIARNQFRAELENQVLDVIRQYWQLYYQRSQLLQHQAALNQAQEILAEIRAREPFDSVDSQVQRVQATVAMRRADIVRAQAEIRNAEARLRALTNSPLLGGLGVELLPVEPPLDQKVAMPIEEARRLALENRAEVEEALARIQAAGVRVGMSKNQMLPSLGLFLETYVSGLEGNYGLVKSLGEQFSEGAPSYTAGVLFEMPLGRRLGKARYQQRQLELRQAEHQFRDAIATLSSQVEIARREVETTWQELMARRESAEATTAEVEYLRARLTHVPGEDHRAVSLALDELLNAIDRLVRDQAALAAAQRNYAIAIAEFHRETGTLVQID